MNAILPWLLLNTLTLAVLVPLVALACRLFSQRPAVQHLLWVVVLVKFLTPPLVVWPWAIDSAIVPEWLTATSQESLTYSNADLVAGPIIDPAAHSTESTIAENSSPLAADAAMASQLKLAELAAQAAALEKDQSIAADAKTELLQADTPARPWSLRAAVSWLLAGVWLLGASVYAVRQARRIARHVRFVQQATPATRQLSDAVDSIARQMNLPAPGVWQSPAIGSPFVWCLGRLRLVWPAALAAPEQVLHARGAIAHELAHIRRHDHHVAWLELAAAMVWWWNPLFWFVRRRLREAAEMSCDALAIAAFPEQRGQYAQLLLELSSVGAGKLPAPVLAIGAGSSKSFERRFTMILSDRATSQVSAFGILTVVCLALLAIPGWAIGQAPTPEAKPAGAPPSASNKQSALGEPSSAAPAGASNDVPAAEAPAAKIDPTPAAANTEPPTTAAPKAEPVLPGNSDPATLERIRALETENKRLLDMLQAIQQGGGDDKTRFLLKRYLEGEASAKPAPVKEKGYRKSVTEYTPKGEPTKKLAPVEAYQRAVADLNTVAQRLDDLRKQQPAPAKEAVTQAEQDLLVAQRQLQLIQEQLKQEDANLQKAIAVKQAIERVNNDEQQRVAQLARVKEAQAQEAHARGKYAEARAVLNDQSLQAARAQADAQQEVEKRAVVNNAFALPAAANPLDIAERYLRAEADLKTAGNKLARIKQIGANGATPQATIDELQIEQERADKLCRLLGAYLDEALRAAKISRDGVQLQYKQTEQLVNKNVISRAELEVAKVHLDEADSVVRQYETIRGIVPAAK